MEIVGVAADVRDQSLKTEPARTVYVPQAQAQDMLTVMPYFLVRTSRSGPAGQAVVEALRRVDARVPTPELRTMGQVVNESLAQERFSAFLMGSFAGLALLLTAFGVYGVIAYTVRRRYREIGIRMALGAEGSAVTRMVTRQGMGPVLLGLLLGVAGSLAVAGILLLVALVASWLPAREATRVDPVRTLSTE